jgi:Ca-activated chloride channel homolog
MAWLRSAHVGLDRPAWLALLAGVPFVLFAARRSLADFPRWQREMQVVVRALVLAAVAGALAGASIVYPTRAVTVVVLADVSASVSGDALRFEQTAARDIAREAAADRCPAPRLVRFAAEAEEVGDLRRPDPGLARFGDRRDANTDIALALGYAVGYADTGAVPRIVLLSDGRGTRGDPRRAAAHLAERGIPVDALSLPAAAAGDAAIAGLAAPDDIRPRAPFTVDVGVAADRALAARVRLTSDRAARVDDADRVVTLAPGATHVAFTVRIDAPGRTTLRAHVAAAGDRRPENDDGLLAIETAREPRVLCLEGTAGAAAAFAHALSTENIVTNVNPARSWARNARGSALASFDLVVLADVPRAALTGAALAALESFVRGGGGLLVAGGTQSFGPGGYEGTALERLLPVRLDSPDGEEEASLALALVIDRSASMAGPKMELTKEAARATAEGLLASDRIAVIAFDNQATPIVELQPAANRQRILTDIGRIQSAGGTNILSGLKEAVDELTTADARKKHIILLSDGQSSYDEIPDLIDTATAARITISAVGVGDGADQTLLKMIAARGGGRFYYTRDPDSIPRIFSRETADLGHRQAVERPTAARVGKPILALRGVDLAAAPVLGGYVATRPRAQAEDVLVTTDGTPLLARWRIGAGQVAAWTSDLGAHWAAAWTRWAGFEKLWTQVARATMRARGTAHFPIRAVQREEQVDVTVDAIGSDDDFLSGLDAHLEATTIDADGQTLPSRALSLPELAPGRYQTSLRPDAESGALLLNATFKRGDAAIADASGRVSMPAARELFPDPAAAETGLATLVEIATTTGGRVLRDPRDAVPGNAAREARHPLRTPILLTALALFVGDVLLRRVRFHNRRRAPAIDSRG